MAVIELSQTTKDAVLKSLIANSNSGVENANFVAAYQAIYNNIKANPNIYRGT